MHEADRTQHLNACTPVAALSTSLALLDRGQDLVDAGVSRDATLFLLREMRKLDVPVLASTHAEISDKFRRCVIILEVFRNFRTKHGVTTKQKRFTKAEKRINNTRLISQQSERSFLHDLRTHL